MSSINAIEVLRTFANNSFAKKVIDTPERQKLFVRIARSIAKLDRPTHVNQWWSIASEAHYYIDYGEGSLERALDKSKAAKVEDWFEEVGFERQANRIKDILKVYNELKEDTDD